MEGGASSGTDRAFGSGKAPGRWTYGGDINGYGTARAFGYGDDLRRWKISDWEPLTHSVLNVTLDGRPMEGIPDPEPLEHLVLVMALDSGLTEGMSHLELLDHSVLKAALVAQRSQCATSDLL